MGETLTYFQPVSAFAQEDFSRVELVFLFIYFQNLGYEIRGAKAYLQVQLICLSLHITL